jgi:hypothetical protein
MSEMEENKPMVLTKWTRRKIAAWKSRIYKKHANITDFIRPLGLKSSRFGHWLHGRNIPPPEWFEKIEQALEDMGV